MEGGGEGGKEKGRRGEGEEGGLFYAHSKSFFSQ